MFRCDNKNCEKYNEPVQAGSIKYKFNESTNKLEPVKFPKCINCGSSMVESKIEGEYKPYWFRGRNQKMWTRGERGWKNSIY